MSRSQAVGFSHRSLFSLLLCTAAITACGGGGSSGGASTSSSSGAAPSVSSSTSPTAPATSPSAATASGAPTISGTPAGSISVSGKYSFVPTAADPDGDALTFTVQNKPAWAAFDAATGTLSGTPAASDINSYANIVISVSDGKNTVSLPAFAIAVTQVSNGNIVLSWTPPTQNMDESALNNIANYRIYYGTDPNQLDKMIVVDKGATSYVVENLSPAEWHFAVSAVTTEAFESDLSNMVAKTVM